MKAVSIFFGILIALAGVNIILKTIFHISIPFFRVLVGIFFVYVGISFLIHRPIFFNYNGHSGYDGNSKYDILFSSSKFDINTIDTSKSSNRFEINTIFADSSIDLSGIENNSQIKTYEINTVFGNTSIYVNESANIDIEVSSAFGQSVLPNGESVAFGNITRKNTNTNSTNNVFVKVNSVFGFSIVKYKK